jgi:hypothetical protein
MKCTRHLCHEAPCKTASMAPLRPRWASLVTSLTPHRPRATKERKNDVQKAPSVLAGTDVQAEDLPLAGFSLHPNGDHHRSRTYPTVLASLHVGCVEPHVGVRALKLSVPKALDLLVKLLTELRNPALGDARHPESLHQLIYLACGDPMHVRLLHHCGERPLSPPARF